MNVTDKELKMFDCFIVPTALTYLKWRKKNMSSLKQQKHSLESMAFEYMKTVHNANNNTLNSFIIDRSFATDDVQSSNTTSSRTRARSSSRRRTSGKKITQPPTTSTRSRHQREDSANEEEDVDEHDLDGNEEDDDKYNRRR